MNANCLKCNHVHLFAAGHCVCGCAEMVTQWASPEDPEGEAIEDPPAELPPVEEPPAEEKKKEDEEADITLDV